MPFVKVVNLGCRRRLAGILPVGDHPPGQAGMRAHSGSSTNLYKSLKTCLTLWQSQSRVSEPIIDASAGSLVLKPIEWHQCASSPFLSQDDIWQASPDILIGVI